MVALLGVPSVTPLEELWNSGGYVTIRTGLKKIWKIWTKHILWHVWTSPETLLQLQAHPLPNACTTFLWSCWETPMRRHKDRKCCSQPGWIARIALSRTPPQVVCCDLALRRDKLRIPQNLLWLVEPVIVVKRQKSNLSHVQNGLVVARTFLFSVRVKGFLWRAEQCFHKRLREQLLTTTLVEAMCTELQNSWNPFTRCSVQVHWRITKIFLCSIHLGQTQSYW